MENIVIDFANVKSTYEFHQTLIEPLELEKPTRGMYAGYKYAENFDALWDLLYCSFYEETTITLRNFNSLRKKLPETTKIAKKVFDDLQKEDEYVTIRYE